MAILNLQIITPKGLVHNDDCHLVTLPAVSGEIGIMYAHELILARLQPGNIKVYDKQNTLLEHFEVKSGGYAKMEGLEKLIVLLDE